MSEANISELKRNIIAIGRLLWEKDLASSLNGNISVRVDDERILLTATRTCLGLLHEEDIVLLKLNGEVLDKKKASSEAPLHLDIFRNFPDARAIVHTHTIYTNAYFLENDQYSPRIYEAKFWLGELKAVPQHAPNVIDTAPVLAALKRNNIAVLKNHGVLSMGEDLFNCFLLIQTLEETLHTEAMARIFSDASRTEVRRKSSVRKPLKTALKKYKLFSKEQIAEIVRLVNEDAQMKELGPKMRMTLTLAVKLKESGKAHAFQFENGRITRFGDEDGAEFLLTAPEAVWRQVFNREIDPIVATQQKKIMLKGDFGKLSKWFEAFQRVFQLWQQVPVE